MIDTASIRDILDFWFLPLGDPGHGAERELWWKSTPELDGEIGVFFYIPFVHSEALADQELACALFSTFDDDQAMKSAREHCDIITRFGRFSHRNEVLGRSSTEEETEYLKQANRYGQ